MVGDNVVDDDEVDVMNEVHAMAFIKLITTRHRLNLPQVPGHNYPVYAISSSDRKGSIRK